MSDQIDEVKQKIDIVSLISEYLELKKAGKNYKALCPFHVEKTPSFMVSPELQIFKCFGCGEVGDVFSFLQKYEGMEFYEVLKYLAEKVGVKLKAPLFNRIEDKERLYQLNKDAAYFYSWILLNHPVGKSALEYLNKVRGLNIVTIRTFGLGFSPMQSLALKRFLVEKKRHSVSDIEKVGLFIIKNGQFIDRFRGRVVFPLYDHRGNIVGFSGRILPVDEGKDLAKYINTPETPIYSKSKVLYALNLNKSEIKKEKIAVVVEGELDALSCWQVGLKNVVAIKGSSLTEDQARLLSRFTEKIILALDTDLAGNQAARKGVLIAETLGLEVRVAELGDYKDPDELARKNPKFLFKAIKNTKSAWDFVIDSVFRKYPNTTGYDKAKISRELIPILSGIENKIVQSHYIEKFARKLGVSLEAVVEEMNKGEFIKRSALKVNEEEKPIRKSRREILEERFLSIAFRYKPKILTKKQTSSLITTHIASRILEEFKKFISLHKSFDPSLFASQLPKELVDSFVDMVLKRIPGVDEETPESLEKELKVIGRELKILTLKTRLKSLAYKIKKLEAKGKKEKVIEAEKKFNKILKKLSILEDKNFKGIIL